MKAVHKTLWALLASGLLLSTGAFAATSGGFTNDLPRADFPTKLITPPNGMLGNPGMGRLPPPRPGNPTCMAIGCTDLPGMKPPVIGGPRPMPPMPPIHKPSNPSCAAIGLPCSGQPPVGKPPVIGGPGQTPPIHRPDHPVCNGVSAPCGGDKPPVIGGPRPPMPPMPPIGKPPREPGGSAPGHPGHPGIDNPMPRPPVDCPDNAMCAQPMPMPPHNAREPGVMLPNGKIEFSKPIAIQEGHTMNGVPR